ncbi:hypothetical protein C0389_01015 [bacterium]|nr:hypothetical protein [bacterium]
MEKQHGASVEKIGMGLICSVETFKKGNICLVKRTSGFNGLSTYNSGEVRKIECKSMEKSDYWIAINGFMAIDKLFFERDYWIYFVILPENIVVMTKALPFIKVQLKLAKEMDFLEELENWVKSTKQLSKKSGLKFFPRINIKFKMPLRKLVEYMTSENYKGEWDKSVSEIWQNKSQWECIFSVKDED